MALQQPRASRIDRPLFLYGVLRDPDLLAAVVGRAIDRRKMLAAVAPGQTTIFYDHRCCPALVPVPGRQAPGLLILGLSAVDRHLIDAFAGGEYRRAIIPVIVEDEVHEADVHLPTMLAGSEVRAWSLESWQQTTSTTCFTRRRRSCARGARRCG